MPQIFGLGAGSGFDIESIVQQLVAIERLPIQVAQLKQTDLTVQLSSFSSLRVSLSNFLASLDSLKSFSAFQAKSISSSDSSVLTAEVTSSAVVGAFTVNEVRTLAQTHKLQSGTFTADTDVVGAGTLKIKVGDSEEKVITIDDDNNTLVGIRDEINAANAGVTASILKVSDTDFRLVLQGTSLGQANAIQVDVVDDDGNNSDLSGLSQFRYTPSFPDPDNVANLTETQAAQDAEFVIDGTTFTRSTNTIADAIEGVTLTLKEATEADANITVTVSASATSVEGSIESFVSTYNTVITELNADQVFNAETGEVGPLQGDSTARIITNRIASLVRNRVLGLESAHQSLVDLGITTEEDGTLIIDSEKLAAEIEKDPLAVGRVFAFVDETIDPTVTTATSGIADQLSTVVSEFLELETGEIATKETGLQSTIDLIGEEVTDLEADVAAFELRTRDKFSKLEAQLEVLNGIGTLLSAQIKQLQTVGAAILGSTRRR